MQVSIQVNVTPPRWLQTKTRRKATALGLVAALVIPGLALASHQFTDVPDSNAFHTNISRVYGARITNGCSATEYCPSANVTREQMAAFLARSGGRVASTSFDTTVAATGSTIGSVTITAGDVAGGTAYAKVDVSAQTWTGQVGCPCDGFIRILDATATIQYATGYYSLGALSTGGWTLDSSTLTAVVPVHTGVATTFLIVAFRGGGTPTTIRVFGNATATYVPFGEAGGNAPATASKPVGKSGVPGN